MPSRVLAPWPHPIPTLAPFWWERFLLFRKISQFHNRWNGRQVRSVRRSLTRWTTWCWPRTTPARHSSAPVRTSVLGGSVGSTGGPAISLWWVFEEELSCPNQLLSAGRCSESFCRSSRVCCYLGPGKFKKIPGILQVNMKRVCPWSSSNENTGGSWPGAGHETSSTGRLRWPGRTQLGPGQVGRCWEGALFYVFSYKCYQKYVLHSLLICIFISCWEGGCWLRIGLHHGTLLREWQCSCLATCWQRISFNLITWSA